MKRRSFVKTTVLGTAAAAILPQLSFGQTKPKTENRMYYELRTYILKDANQQSLVENYFEKAAIPALNKLGIKNVGVFTEIKPSGQPTLIALIPSWIRIKLI
jgi:hypothetical protein